MKNALYVKTLALAIAASFLLMAGNGLGNDESEQVVFGVADIPDAILDRSLDSARLKSRVGDSLNSIRPIEKNSVVFNEDFEDDVLGDIPDDPPWLVTEQPSYSQGNWGPDEFEDDVLGGNPDLPWQTVDGATGQDYWFRDHEDTSPSQDLRGGYYMGDDGAFGTFAGDVTLTAVTRPAGTPAGSIASSYLTPGTMAAQFNEGANTGVQSYFGPAGIENGGQVTSAYAGSWIRMPATTTAQFFLLYEVGVGTVVQLLFYNGQVSHYPGGTSTVLTTYSANTWYEFFIQYNEAAKTYSVWWNGAQMAAGSAWIDAALHSDIDGMLFLGAESAGVVSNLYLDNWYHFIPPTGGAHVVQVSNAWSASMYGGSQSVMMDQNNYASQAASVTVNFDSPYAWGEFAGCSWVVRTADTVANTNGAQFLLGDYNGRTLMAMRFSGGNIQYQTGAAWVTMQTFAANTEYGIDMYMNTWLKEYSGAWIGSNFYDLTGVQLVNLGAGVSSFRMQATVSTQSTIYLDGVTMYGDLQDGTVRISDMYAHSGSQSVRMWEGGGDSYCDMGAYMGGDLSTFGEFSFWFYGDGTLGGGVIYLLDTSQTNIVTIISLGSDLSSANIPQPGMVKWIDGDGAGGGWIIDGPTINPNTWNQISIAYDTNAGTFEASWNGIPQGEFGMLDPAPDAGIVFFFGEGPAAPCDWFFDDIGLWVDDVPGEPQNLRVYAPEPLPGTFANYFTNLDSAVEGAVTGTHTDTHAIDMTLQSIQEAPVGGGPSQSTYTYVGVTAASGPHDAYYLDMDDSTQAELTTPNSRTENTDAQYTQISTSNDVRRAGVAPGAQDEIGWEFRYAVSENPAYITQIDLTLEANWAAAGCVVTCFALNTVTSTWDTIGTTMTFTTSGTDYTMTRSITSNPSNYVSSGAVRCVFYGSSTNVASNVDFARCVVSATIPPTYSLEHRWRTENVPAGADILTLHVTGATNWGTDDSFTVGYSTVLAGPYSPVLSINTGTMTTFKASLPTSLSGQFYLNIADSNGADEMQDTVFIDCIRIYWQDITGLTTSTQIATADNPVDGAVVGTYALTNPPANAPPDSNAQQITEVDPNSFGPNPIEIWSSEPGPSPTDVILPAESFETAVPPTGWSTVNGPGTRHWQQATNGNPFTSEFGSAYAYVNYDSAYAQNEWLITPSMDCSAFNNLQMTYCIAQGTGWEDYIYIRVSTNGGSSWSGNLVTHFQSGLTMTTANMQTLDLSAYDMSANLQVAFILWTALADAGDSVGLDMVTITGDPAGTTLEHVWTMNNLPDNALARNVYVNARYSTASDDNFQFGWSQNVNGPFTPIMGLLVNSDSYAQYTGSIPTEFSGGPLYINVIDTSGGDATYSTVYVDSLYVESLISPVNTSVNVVWDLSADDGGGQNDVMQYNVYYSDAEIGGNEMGTYNYLGSSPAGTTMYQHYGEADDFVDNIWYIVAAQDTYSEGFTTMRATKFNVAPEVNTALANSASAIEVPQGTPVDLTALIYDATSTWEDILKMDGAEWFANVDPGEGSGTPMADDGMMDSVWEWFTDTIDTTSWAPGSYYVQVRGHEAAPGNTGSGWGPTRGVWVNITGAPTPYAISLTGKAANSWVFVSFPSAMSGDIQTILNDATAGDGGTVWTVAKWQNVQDPADPWKTYRVGGTANDMPTLTNTMGVWLWITANGGDQMLTLSSYAAPSASAVNVNLYVGWNMVGYPSMTARLASATLPVQADWVSVWQAASPYVTDYSNLGLVTMSAGNAYWVHVTADCVWSVQP